MRKNDLSKRDRDAHLEAYLAISILHPPLTQKTDISDSRSVIRYLQRQHTMAVHREGSKGAHDPFIGTKWKLALKVDC